MASLLKPLPPGPYRATVIMYMYIRVHMALTAKASREHKNTTSLELEIIHTRTHGVDPADASMTLVKHLAENNGSTNEARTALPPSTTTV